MIVTVTLNPSIDRTLTVPALIRGEVIRAESTMADPGGKGVNVTRFLTAHGTDSVAVLPAGGATGNALLGLLDDAGIPHRAIPIAGTPGTGTPPADLIDPGAIAVTPLAPTPAGRTTGRVAGTD